jgi:putative addiction module component (TIGR02574 family)
LQEELQLTGDRIMSEAALELREQLARLPKQERAELAHFLIDTLEGDLDVDYDPAWEAELLRRETEIRNGTAKGVPAAEVIAAMEEKYS